LTSRNPSYIRTKRNANGMKFKTSTLRISRCIGILFRHEFDVGSRHDVYWKKIYIYIKNYRYNVRNPANDTYKKRPAFVRRDLNEKQNTKCRNVISPPISPRRSRVHAIPVYFVAFGTGAVCAAWTTNGRHCWRSLIIIINIDCRIFVRGELRTRACIFHSTQQHSFYSYGFCAEMSRSTVPASIQVTGYNVPYFLVFFFFFFLTIFIRRGDLPL